MYVWVGELVAYVLLAQIEELFLGKRHGVAYDTYRGQVPFLVPLLVTRRKILDVLVAISVFALLLVLLLNTQPA
jgi:hypothetical protein